MESRSINRRLALSSIGAAGLRALGASEGMPDRTAQGSADGWEHHDGNPVLGDECGTCFNICVIEEESRFSMLLSRRPKKSIALSESSDGTDWSASRIALAPNLSSRREDDFNRPVVVRRADGIHVWYIGQARSEASSAKGRLDGHSAIGYATNSDGVAWVRESEKPVLAAELPWENAALMCPDVLWDSSHEQQRMRYSGGAQYGPSAIGHATSKNGLHWVKDLENQILPQDPQCNWGKQRVVGIQAIYLDGWLYAFYIGYSDIDRVQIGLARSRDGLNRWERGSANPIIRSTGTGLHADACNKPYAVLFKGKWMLWNNGQNVHLEQIALATRSGRSLGFEE